jgi:hypothetical protein
MQCNLRLFVTRRERVANIARIATTEWLVIDHLTLGILATQAFARVHALQIYTTLVTAALFVAGTFGATCWWRTSVAFRTRTRGTTVDNAANTGRRTAFTWVSVYDGRWNILFAAGESVTDVTGITLTHGHMIDHNTLGVGPTNTGTRIRAMLVDARLLAGTVRVVDTFWSTAGVRVTKVRWNTGTFGGAIDH